MEMGIGQGRGDRSARVRRGFRWAGWAGLAKEVGRGEGRKKADPVGDC